MKGRVNHCSLKNNNNKEYGQLHRTEDRPGVIPASPYLKDNFGREIQIAADPRSTSLQL
jgi:hypothetical protein